METSMKNNNPKGTDHWDRIAKRTNGPLFQDQIALYKRKVHLDLISAWAPRGQAMSVLKTDLFEEAFGKDSLLDALGASYAFTVGIDISCIVVNKAKLKFPEYPSLVTNVCNLPFKEKSFDLIVSNSTLDHFPPRILPDTMNELWRILKPEGCLILTLDSRHNILHVLSNYIRRWMGKIYAERCYTIKETSRMLKESLFKITDVTAIYHIPPGVNFLAKKLHKSIGPGANKWIQYVIDICNKVGQFPTLFLSGRYIALRAIKTDKAKIEGKKE